MHTGASEIVVGSDVTLLARVVELATSEVVVSVGLMSRFTENHGESAYCQSSRLFKSPKVRTARPRSRYSPSGIDEPLAKYPWDAT